ncbi:MAG: hypothetical protein WCA35_31195 [Kovacikia sp.]
MSFLRRLDFIISFLFSSQTDRQRMWERVFPTQIPKAANLDFAWLARMTLTGGSIINVALNAAFAAAESEEKQITMPLVLAAARSEFRKLDRPVKKPILLGKPRPSLLLVELAC